jgi:hypothetical protein
MLAVVTGAREGDKSSTKSAYSSSLFQGLLTTGIGAVCNITRGKNCGRIHTSSISLNACLGKSNLRGSFWFECRQTGTCPKGRATQPDVAELTHIQAIETVNQDIVVIDYRQLYNSETTPEHVVNALFDLLDSDVTYEDIPIELIKYGRILSKREQEEEDKEWGV